MSSGPADSSVALPSGRRVLLRPIRPDDDAALAAGFEGLSGDSRYLRFFALKTRLSDSELEYLTKVDHRDHEALVAIDPDTAELCGVARFVRDPQRPDTAEIAVTVADRWQGAGLGTALLQHLSRRAAEEGVRRFTAEVLIENGPMLELVRRLGDTTTEFAGDGITRASVVLHDEDEVRTTGFALLRAAGRGQVVALSLLGGAHRLVRRLRRGSTE